MRTLKQEILDVENYPMSFEEIKTVLTGRVPGLQLRFLLEKNHNFKNIWKSKVNICFTLLEVSNLHHWTVFSKKFFYDPLGNSPQFFKTNWPKFYEVVKDLDWNTYPHEKNSKNIQSCGEHCLVRAVKYHLDNSDFHKWLVSLGIQTDKLVSVMCYIGLRNAMRKHAA